MMIASGTNSIWQPLVDLFSTPSLQLFLIIGFAILGCTVLFLAMTRWGQSRPIMKCVILSVAAHILLLGYFYGTNLIFQYPAIEKGNSMSVSLIGYEVEVGNEAEEHQTVTDTEPWDEGVSELPMPEADELVRPTIENDLEVERNKEEISVPGFESDEPIESEWDETALDTDQSLFEKQLAVPSLTTTEIAKIEPEKVEFRRRGEGDDLKSVEPSAEITPVATDPAELSGIQALAIRSETNPEFSQAARNEAFSSEFVVPDAQIASVDDYFPASPASKESTSRPDDEAEFSSAANPPPPVTRPRRLGDGLPVPQIYELRLAANRDHVAIARGGSKDTQEAVADALAWLASQQEDDGRWNPRMTQSGRETNTLGHDREGAGGQADTGITALATLAFLGAGNTHLEGRYQVSVQHALEYLIGSQAPDGNLSGGAKVFARTYCHSMALLALSEALAVTGDQRLKDAVERGVNFSARSQNLTDGGWRYKPGDRGDMSQFGWQVMAMHSASIGGVQVPAETVDRMHRFLHLCTSGPAHGLASYRPGQGVTSTMTAEALVCRYFMKKTVSRETVHEAARKLMSDRPRNSRINMYYWYYATMALYHSGDENWEAWNRSLTETLLPMQIRTGPSRGSWPPNGLWAGYGGRVYSTAMATLCLEVYYRYLPVSEVVQDD
ncbi:MAG: terpene cyclase/mutase family protein [Mariniblastus sp.]|nr:terpene cyclase/mutase family protein [Mariniblastus sp.]